MYQLSKAILATRILALSIMSLLPRAVSAEPANYRIRLDLRTPQHATVEAELEAVDGYFGNYSQPIRVGHNRCQCHYGAVASVQIRRIRKDPACQEVCDGAHANNLTGHRQTGMMTGVTSSLHSSSGVCSLSRTTSQYQPTAC